MLIPCMEKAPLRAVGRALIELGFTRHRHSLGNRIRSSVCFNARSDEFGPNNCDLTAE